MTAKDVIRAGLDSSEGIINAYIGDLSDAELLVRPVPGMNHIAWQLGHILGAERHFIEMIKPGVSPPLPENFDAGHGRNATKVDDPSLYYPAARYLELWKAQRAVTRRVLDELPEAELDRKDDRFPPISPTVGALLSLCGGHPVMHAGQFVAVRRLLNKPVTI